MSANPIFCALLVLGLSVASAAPSAKTETVGSAQERQAYAAAESLYVQSFSDSIEQTARNAQLTQILGDLQAFLKTYPSSPYQSKALYMCASCAEELGRKELARQLYQDLADSAKSGTKDDCVASAAYKLATQLYSRGLNNADGVKSLKEALKYYGLAEQCSTHEQLVYDARYRMARVYSHMATRSQGAAAKDYQQKALAIYKSHFSTESSRIPAHIQGAAHYSYAQLLSVGSSESQSKAALEQYKLYLKSADDNREMRSKATLEVARLSAKLGMSDESDAYYKKLDELGHIDQYDSAVKMEVITALFRAEQYERILSMFREDSGELSFLESLETESQRAACACMLGQVYMLQNQYAKAGEFFNYAEQHARNTPVGADAGYRLIVCLQQLYQCRSDDGTENRNLPDLLAYGESYLRSYGAVQSTETSHLPCTDLARVIVADHILTVSNENPWRYYAAVNISNLPEYIVEDTAYKRAWCLYRAWLQEKSAETSPQAALNYYIDELKSPKHLADMLCTRGDFFLESKFHESAVSDYNKVIAHHKDSSAYPACLQRAANACMSCQPPQNEAAKKYLRLLLSYAEESKDADSTTEHQHISVYAAAEANFNLGRLCFHDETEAAIDYFKAALDLNEKAYSASASACLIQCYYKLKNTHKQQLLNDLPVLKREYNAQYRSLSKAIPRWCGWTWYHEAENQPDKKVSDSAELKQRRSLQHYRLAVEYLNDSIDRNQVEEYTDENGAQALRPVSEPLVWLTLARACLEVEQYESTEQLIGGLEAVNYYLSMETDPHRRADGLRTKAMLLNGMGNPQQALDLCNEALNLGVNGPVLSALRLVAGDASFLLRDFEKAAEFYGLVANLDRNNDLNREALFKTACALRQNGKLAEADNYEVRLKSKLKELNINASYPLEGMPPSVGRHVLPASGR